MINRNINRIRPLLLFAITLISISFIAGCKKDGIVVPPQISSFIGSSGNYTIATPTTVYKIPVGLTSPSDGSRIINVTVTSSTGAVAGTHFNLNKTSFTLPKGAAQDTLIVSGIQAQYLSGRKDVLTFTITDESNSISNLPKIFTLNVKGPCFEGDVDLNAFLGDYDNTIEDFGGAYGPYTTTVTAVNQLTPTTGTISIRNLWDAGWQPITFTLDWTNPANRTVTVISQSSGIADAGTLSGTYAGQQVAVRPFAGQVGTFSACEGTIFLSLQLGVAGLGFFGQHYTVRMER
jgi:hypothetical protein